MHPAVWQRPPAWLWVPAHAVRNLSGELGCGRLLKVRSCDAGGRPLVVAHPSSPTAEAFMELGAGLVREVAKMQRQERNAVR